LALIFIFIKGMDFVVHPFFLSFSTKRLKPLEGIYRERLFTTMNRGENVKENIISYSTSALSDGPMYHPKTQNRFNGFPITFYFIKLNL